MDVRYDRGAAAEPEPAGPSVNVDLLAAYAAIEGWAKGRTVLVFGGRAHPGPSALLRAGAARVWVVAGDEEGFEAPADGLEVLRPDELRGLPPGSVGLLVDLDRYGSLAASERAERLRWAGRVLSEQGLLVVRVPAEGGAVDFWTLESELSAAFADVALLAQVPWNGYSIAPVLDADAGDPALDLVESLLESDPDAAHFLAVAGRDHIPAEAVSRCVLVPVPADPLVATWRQERVALAEEAKALRDRLAALEEELERVRARASVLEQERVRLQEEAQAARARAEEARERAEGLNADLASARDRLEALREERAQLLHRLDRADTDMAVVRQQVAEKERAIARTAAALREKGEALDDARRTLSEAELQVRRLEAEREELRRQVDVAIAEREGVRQLLQRAEAEVEVLRKKLAQRDADLAARIEEASRAQGELAVLRERLSDPGLRTPPGVGAEVEASGRLLAEVARDRDRLREALTQRNQSIASLEERLWNAREELQRTQLEVAKLSAQLDAARDRLATAEESDRERGEELARLRAALREAEVARAELSATLRAREEALARVSESTTDAGPPGAGPAALEEEIARREAAMERLRAELAEARTREEEARTLLAQAEAQVAELSQRLDAAAEQVRDRDGKIARLQETLQVVQAERAQIERRAEAAEGALASLREAYGALEKERADLQERVEAEAVEKAALERRLAAVGGRSDGDGGAVERDVAEVADLAVDPTWPPAAQAAVTALKRVLVAAGRGGGRDAADRLLRELAYRVDEQAQMLERLEAAEQRNWEMADTADRNAARLAASLAQLEQTKEQLDEMREELQVTRSMHAAERARVVELERLLRSERAKLARAGLGPEGFPARPPGAGSEVEEVFYELNPDVAAMMPLEDPGSAVAIPVAVEGDRSSLPPTPGRRAGGRGSEGGVSGIRVEAADPAAWRDAAGDEEDS